jgi:hypothetical protein
MQRMAIQIVGGGRQVHGLLIPARSRTTTTFTLAAATLKRQRKFIGALYQQHSHSQTFSTESSTIFKTITTSIPRLESATGRARKRRRKILQRARKEANKSSQLTAATTTKDKEEAEETRIPPQYEPGKPWQVIFPRYHFDPNEKEEMDDNSSQSTSPRATLGDYRRALPQAWEIYLQSWGIEPKKKPTDSSALASVKEEQEQGPSLVEQTQQNVTENLKVAKQEGQVLLEAAQEQTGIRNKDDIKMFASDMLKLATETLKEFMAGYRQGRDKEIDRMLHEYFQEEDDEKAKKDQEKEESAMKKKKRRKTKRRILRD